MFTKKLVTMFLCLTAVMFLMQGCWFPDFRDNFPPDNPGEDQSDTSTDTSTDPQSEDPLPSVNTLERDADPVVLSAEDLALLIGMEPNKLVAFSFNGTWQQIPVQVDEQTIADYYDIYNQEYTRAGVFTNLVYADPGTLTGPDSDPMIDADDEVVFMARDAGSKAIGFIEPEGVVAGSGAEVHVYEPETPEQEGYVYLFEQDGSLDPAAGRRYGSYKFHLIAGEYPKDYGFRRGPNPEDTWFIGATYERHFSDRYITDVLNLTAPDASGVDILDVNDSWFAPASCGRSVLSFSNGEGAFIANKTGPVRSIRSYIGCNSGPRSQRTHLFYDKREDIITDLRVHAIPSIYDIVDYSKDAAGMIYYNIQNQDGAVIDGSPDDIVAANGSVESDRLEWEMVTGPQGTLVIAHNYDTNIDLTLSSFYLDEDPASVTPCNGDDDAAYAQSGPAIISNLPSTDAGSGNIMRSYRIHYHSGPGGTVEDAERLAHNSRNPLARELRPVGR